MKLLNDGRKVLREHKWLAFLLPMAVFMLVGSVEPKPNSTAWPNIPYSAYPWVYAVKLLATIVALVLVWPEYKVHCKPVGWKGFVVGILGAFVWITLCNSSLEETYLQPFLKALGIDSIIGNGERSAFNPFHEFHASLPAVIAYLVVRGIGLILVVPVMEEYFLRGFAMRYVASEKWAEYPIGKVTIASAMVGTFLPMLMHPGELFAAAVWFSMITALAWQTKNLWECIVAHGTTNLILGGYVLLYGAWHLV